MTTFSQYCTETDPESGVELATVPDRELAALTEELHLARAASPAQCLHPASGLQSFELIDDGCVCGGCGAVLKWYGAPLAQALRLGVNEGWYRLDADLLSMEIYLAFLPMIEAVDYFCAEMGPYGGAAHVRAWANLMGSQNAPLHARARVA